MHSLEKSEQSSPVTKTMLEGLPEAFRVLQGTAALRAASVLYVHPNHEAEAAKLASGTNVRIVTTEKLPTAPVIVLGVPPKTDTSLNSRDFTSSELAYQQAKYFVEKNDMQRKLRGKNKGATKGAFGKKK